LYFTDSRAENLVSVVDLSPAGRALSRIAIVRGLPNRDVRLLKQELHGVMDVEVSWDGNTLLVSRAVWDMAGIRVSLIASGDIELYRKGAAGFVSDPSSADVFANVNSEDVEYAAALSQNRLELFFTRIPKKALKQERVTSYLGCAVRETATGIFSNVRILAGEGKDEFVEGPSLSSDGRELYFHRRSGKRMQLMLMSRRKRA
jgi:Tol biopolymer transport system component